MHFLSEIWKREVVTRDVSTCGWFIYVWKTGNTKVIKKKIKEKFNISEFIKVKKFLGVYYKWGHDVKGTYVKMTMEKDVKNLIEGYEKFTVSDLRIQKTPWSLCKSLGKNDLEEPDNINMYRSFVVQLMWYTAKVGSDVANAARELAVHISHPGLEHWKALVSFIRYLCCYRSTTCQ